MAQVQPGVLDFLDRRHKPVRTRVRAPGKTVWRDAGWAARAESAFDHVIALDEAHVQAFAREYMAYYPADRTHDGLGKDTPRGRAIEPSRPGEADFAAACRRTSPSIRVESCGLS